MQNKVHNRVRFYRKQLNLTQEQFAGKLKVSRQTIIAIENEKYNPTLALALNISKLLNKPLETIFSLDEDFSPPAPPK
ncbi:helix-turn-helix transcriptional regulator [Candidatus Contubernalis alkaliaceticus]|uniref:helix-turn-helix transcriptional regulator n=1 Tax=Candidatus Contubernalis alkaliaceticus TaxID=338645 RepID=UPI001F4BD4D8|nr:helix-turn-helix transcriptional regulator [Candidatus Contubernalis alkalaceticus]UNC93021.1 helix-turn-helix transcriptional regulator [Candidatus Contubernalis alkalaceticus]